MKRISCKGLVLGILAAAGLSMAVSLDAGAYEERNYISAAYAEAVSENGGVSLIKTGGDWFPYPDYDDREGWSRLLGDGAARIVSEGEKYLDYEWKVIPATAYLEYERSGNRKIMESLKAHEHSQLLYYLPELIGSRVPVPEQCYLMLYQGMIHLINIIIKLFHGRFPYNFPATSPCRL